ncbi:hypothetical protein ZIOFF_033440 [Zingiber officinale]|uniref:Uncharacterized protein n=1 Tax=Zingiber officinale TaxID=94328 RepID=A0A8J5GKA8_ZINOF|nr:hypothetical protein ZIOFF_033440 [Zingiber officinale]
MERNGKNHGMVRVAAMPKPACKAPAAPPIAKAPAKPTNHPKFTGKICRGARGKESRSIPESKSRDKAKGAWKLKSLDVLLNYRLVDWRLVDAGAVADDDGEEGRRHHLSATEMVEKLYANCNTFHESLTMEEEEERDFEEEEEEEEERDVEEEKESNGGDEERDETHGDAVAGVSREFAEGEEWFLVEKREEKNLTRSDMNNVPQEASNAYGIEQLNITIQEAAVTVADKNLGCFSIGRSMYRVRLAQSVMLECKPLLQCTGFPVAFGR